MISKEIISTCEEDTFLLGYRIGKLLKGGEVITLDGDLGCGKTVFVKGLGQALGIEHIVSPTFTIVQEYDSDPPLFHFDVYRISDPDELYAIGFEDYLSDSGVIVMEWADLVAEILPHIDLSLRFARSGDNTRRILLEGEDRWEAIQ